MREMSIQNIYSDGFGWGSLWSALLVVTLVAYKGVVARSLGIRCSLVDGGRGIRGAGNGIGFVQRYGEGEEDDTAMDVNFSGSLCFDKIMNQYVPVDAPEAKGSLGDARGDIIISYEFISISSSSIAFEVFTKVQTSYPHENLLTRKELDAKPAVPVVIEGVELDLRMRGFEFFNLVSSYAFDSLRPIHLKATGRIKFQGKVIKPLSMSIADELHKNKDTEVSKILAGDVSITGLKLNQLMLAPHLGGVLNISRGCIRSLDATGRPDESLSVEVIGPLESITKDNVIGTMLSFSLQKGQLRASVCYQPFHSANLEAELQLNFQKRRGHGILSLLHPKFSGVLGEALDLAARWSGDVVSTSRVTLAIDDGTGSIPLYPHLMFDNREISERIATCTLKCLVFKHNFLRVHALIDSDTTPSYEGNLLLDFNWAVAASIVSVYKSLDWEQEGGDPCLRVPWSWMECNSDPQPKIMSVPWSWMECNSDPQPKFIDMMVLFKLTVGCSWRFCDSWCLIVRPFFGCPDLYGIRAVLFSDGGRDPRAGRMAMDFSGGEEDDTAMDVNFSRSLCFDKIMNQYVPVDAPEAEGSLGDARGDIIISYEFITISSSSIAFELFTKVQTSYPHENLLTRKELDTKPAVPVVIEGVELDLRMRGFEFFNLVSSYAFDSLRPIHLKATGRIKFQGKVVKPLSMSIADELHKNKDTEVSKILAGDVSITGLKLNQLMLAPHLGGVLNISRGCIKLDATGRPDESLSVEVIGPLESITKDNIIGTMLSFSLHKGQLRANVCYQPFHSANLEVLALPKQ
ncbi:hypothetical protein CTI12_AA406070 [Artemisia annua]|uniref:Uncharacterized protein n=1 Tax=Artemisia annua TaxID=35608 RepID=A0A2U1M8X8_ARTAN|nr:hypothetical protein CTI12_AA406070 [Artemisia annua]